MPERFRYNGRSINPRLSDNIQSTNPRPHLSTLNHLFVVDAADLPITTNLLNLSLSADLSLSISLSHSICILALEWDNTSQVCRQKPSVAILARFLSLALGCIAPADWSARGHVTAA